MYRKKRCPTCTSHQIRRSHRRAIERTLFFLFPYILPHRCNECGRRFYILSLRSSRQSSLEQSI
jgi:hypothetical protein